MPICLYSVTMGYACGHFLLADNENMSTADDTDNDITDARSESEAISMLRLLQEHSVKSELAAMMREEMRSVFRRVFQRVKLIMTVLLTVSDQSTDVLTMTVYYQNNDIGWFYFSLGLLCISQVAMGVMVYMSKREAFLPKNRFARFFLGFFGIAPFLAAKESWGDSGLHTSLTADVERMEKFKLIETLFESVPQLTLQVYVSGIVQTSEHHLQGKDLVISVLSIILSVLSIKQTMWGMPRIRNYNVLAMHCLETVFFVGWIGRWAVFGAAYRAFVLVLFAGEVLLMCCVMLALERRCSRDVLKSCMILPAFIVLPFRNTKSQIIMTLDAVVVTVVMYAFTLPKTGLLSQQVHLCEDRVGCFSHQFIWIILILMGIFVVGSVALAAVREKPSSPPLPKLVEFSGAATGKTTHGPQHA